MENQIKQFIQNPSEQNGYIVLRTLRYMNAHFTSVFIGQFLSKLYPESIDIRSETAVSAYYTGQYRLSYDLYSKNLEYPNIDVKNIQQNISNRRFSMDHITDDFIHYNKELVDSITSRPVKPIPIVTFTITTCKRFDLFEKTINSFLNCCIDLDRIDKWFCIDDNSCTEDRNKMKTKYPFFTFYWKTPCEKGHPRSMNIIRESVKTLYIFHMEDDWKFFHRRPYITDCMEILTSDQTIGQCIVNLNYAETLQDFRIKGGHPGKTKRGVNYYIHEYTPNEDSKKTFNEKYKDGYNCAYWPHFSFRPSLLKSEVLTKLGSYDETISHFEMDYSYKYVNTGFKSCFLDGIFCIHIGRLTSQRDNKEIPNAYDLNNETQFNGKEEAIKRKSRLTMSSNVKTFVVNMDSRVDRLKTFDEKTPINFERFSAVTGSILKPNPQLQKIFEGNDYNMRTGIVGAAMSHIKLCINLVQSASDTNIYCIFEDDVTFSPKFKEHFAHIMNNLPDKWDIIYLGHSLYPQHKTNDCFNTEVTPVLQKGDASIVRKSMGGMFAYIISKEGALKFLKFINNTGMINGIDTMQQKAINIMETYYSYPHIVYAECALPGVLIDSDIQYTYNSLNLPDYKDEGKYPDRLKKNGVYDISDALEFKNVIQHYKFIRKGVELNFVPGGNMGIFNWFMNVFPTWETDTYDILEKVANKDKVAIDIGCWIGPIAMYLSKTFKHVFVAEPDKVALESLRTNLSFNECKNVTVIDKPVSSSKSIVYFGNNKFRNSSEGDSTSQIKTEKTHSTDSLIETITLDEMIKDVDPTTVGFIKVDIEGGEENIIDTLFSFCYKYKCSMWLAFHYSWWNDKNIERFNYCFSLATKTTVNNIDIGDVSSYVKEHPIDSIYFSFE